MGKELEVFGKAAPSAMNVDEWMIGDASAVNLSKGVSLLVSGKFGAHTVSVNPIFQRPLKPTTQKDFKWLA